ncbi:unnamed protein product, partial [Brenthis ino]
MLRIAVLHLFVLQILTIEPPPPECRGPASTVKNPLQCCIFGPLFRDQDFKECGIELQSDDEDKVRHGIPDCESQICLMSKNNLMKDDDTIDKDALNVFMDNWAFSHIINFGHNNKSTLNAVNEAKNKCIQKELPGPSEACEANKIVFCITSTIFAVNGQLEHKVKPEKCYGTDELENRRCCIFPPFFNRAVARECGAGFALMSIDNKHNVTNMRRHLFNSCDHWRCILNTYSILDAEENVNNENYFAHLDKWTALNPEFNNAMTDAKVYCRDEFRANMPVKVCDFFEYQKCIRHNIMVSCPKVINSPECFEWKEFYEECKEFFH